MTIDQQARTTFAESTRWLIGGRITNFQFDDAVPKSPDPAIREIYNQFLWLLYCDLREHRLIGADKLSQVQRDAAARCVLFLKSGLPYLWPVLSRVQSALLTFGNLLTFGLAGHIYFRRLSSAGDMTYWPFLSQSQYAAALGAPVYLSAAGASSRCRFAARLNSSVEAHMKHFWLLGLLFLATPEAFARSAEICPALPSNSGFEWHYSEGPDFDVCRASALGAEDMVFGVYLGNHPSFHPERSSRIGKGKVGGRRVVWYRQEGSDSNSTFSRQALVTLDRKRGDMAHIWVVANTEQQLQDRLSVLERMVFKVP